MSTNHSLPIWSSMKFGSLENWYMQAYRILPILSIDKIPNQMKSSRNDQNSVDHCFCYIYIYGWKVIRMLSLRCVLFPLVTDELKSGGSELEVNVAAGICRWRGLNGFQRWENWARSLIQKLFYAHTRSLRLRATYMFP